MTMWLVLAVSALCALGLAVSGCETPRPPPYQGASVRSGLPPVTVAIAQTRILRTQDRGAVLRAVVTTLMDQGYVLNHVDSASGGVWANRGALLKLVVTLSPHGRDGTAVRAVADVQDGAALIEVDDMAFYDETFFVPLSAMLGLPAPPAT